MKDDPNTNKAKMLALLALLDCIEGNAEMTAVGTDRVGQNDRYGRGGQIRLRFTMFGNETRLLGLAHELAYAGSHADMMRQLEARIDRTEKLRFAVRMIETWTEVMQRLLAEPADDAELSDGGTQHPALHTKLRQLKDGGP